jgi:uncharacterized protein YkwD
MGQHRKTKHYRRIVITAAAIGAVGVPSVALACSEWPYAAQGQSQAAVPSAPVVRWQPPAGHHPSNGYETALPQTAIPQSALPQTATAPQTAIPAATAPAAPQVTVQPSAKQTVAAPRPARTAAPTAPRPTAAPASAAPAAPSTPEPTATAAGVTAEILRLVNAERNQAGCRPLVLNSTLSKAAQAHSADMAAHQNMSHTGSDGSSPGDRITRAGYTWSSYGENVAYGYSTAQQVMDGWMSSPGHRANILNCGFKEIGVGLAQPGSYWTQDFGTAR